jgi:hypothetical protein
MKLLLKITASVILAAALIWYFGLDLSLWFISQNQGNISQYTQQVEQDFEKFYPQMLVDAKTMEEISIFNPLSYNKDASDFLNPLVSWSDRQNADGPKDLKPQPLKLNSELVNILNSKKEFSQIKIDWSKYNLDFSWFKKLQNYDHWNYTQSTPYVKNETNFEVMTAPTPNYSEFTDWSKLYLLYSRDTKQLKANTEHIDHLAKLIYSHQSYLNAMVAINLLKIKKEFHASLNEAEQSQVLGVIPNNKVIKALQRFVSAVAGMYSILTPDTVFNNARLIKISTCLLLEESVSMNADLKFLFSLSYPDAIMRIDQMKQQSVSWCPETYAKKAWDSQSYQDRLAKMNPFEMAQGTNNLPASDTASADTPTKSDLTLADLSKSPKIAKAITDIILSIGSLDPFRMYKD